MMQEDVLLKELDTMTEDATGNNSTFIKVNEELLDRYEGNPYGNEVAERSSVISNDVMDIVESDMPSLARVFLGSGEILKFKPNTQREDDVKEADQKTKYVHWQVREQPWSFSVIHGFIKNAEIQKISVVKYFYEETTEVEEHKKTGLSDDELALIQADLESENETAEVTREEETDGDENTVVFKVERTHKSVQIENVELENFRFTKNAKDKNSAAIVGDVSLMTRGELLSKGFKRELISKLTKVGDTEEDTKSRLPEIRDADEGGPHDTHIADNWASEEVEVEDLYPLIDYDNDGIAERRHIMRSGDFILLNEVFNHVPYAMMPAILMPHKAIGKSRAEITAPTAKAKTAILRGIQDNIYAVNSPGMGINENVEMDDLLVLRPQRIVRNKGKGSPSENMFPVIVPYVGDKALQVIQYWDQQRAQTTGSLLASQGLDADELGKETATRFEGIEDASKGKVELVARVMAETGFRQLFEGIAWIDAQFQNSEVEIEVLGEELKVNPADWKFRHSVVSRVGLGAGDDEHVMQSLTGLWVMHQQLQAMNSPMTDEVKRYNIAKGITEAAGFPDPSEYFNNPEKPEELMQAQNEIMTKIIEEMQIQVQNLQNPLAEAETIKAQASLIKATGEQSLKVGQMQQEEREFRAEFLQKQDQFMKDLALKITELELEHKVELPEAEAIQ